MEVYMAHNVGEGLPYGADAIVRGAASDLENNYSSRTTTKTFLTYIATLEHYTDPREAKLMKQISPELVKLEDLRSELSELRNKTGVWNRFKNLVSIPSKKREMQNLITQIKKQAAESKLTKPLTLSSEDLKRQKELSDKLYNLIDRCVDEFNKTGNLSINNFDDIKNKWNDLVYTQQYDLEPFPYNSLESLALLGNPDKEQSVTMKKLDNLLIILKNAEKRNLDTQQ